MLIRTSVAKVHCSIKGEGQPVVLIHGFGSSEVQWMYTAPALAASGYQCITLDLPGFGQSELPTQPITTARYADVLEEVLHHLGLTGAILVGNSMGAFVAWICASRTGSLVRGLVLSNSAGAQQDSSLPSRSRRSSGRTHSFLTVPGLASIAGLKLSNPLTRMLVRPLVEKSYGDTARITPEVFNALHSAAKQSRIVLKNMLHFESIDADALLKAIKCPTLIMWGDKDNIIPLAAMDYFVDRIPQAKLKVYFGVGHVPMLEVPDEFNADLLAFLAKVDGMTSLESHIASSSLQRS